jgi:hypothetical protein
MDFLDDVVSSLIRHSKNQCARESMSAIALSRHSKGSRECPLSGVSGHWIQVVENSP